MRTDQSSNGGTAARFVNPAETVLAGGGELGALMRATDWSQTPLGPVESWPQSLKTCVRIILTSRQPMFVWWGDSLINLYNDAYKSIIGGKHPAALGQPAAVVWREIWDQVGPRARSAVRDNEATYDEALLLIMERHGYQEETYYTFSYSPVPNDHGDTGGLICANTDDTQRIITERQLALLRELAAHTVDARTWEDVCTLSVASLKTNPSDLPFALIYLLDHDQQHLVLAGAAGIEPGHPAAQERIPLDGSSAWPFAQVLRSQQPVLVPDVDTVFQGLPTGAWPRPPRQAAVVPIAATGRTGRPGFLVVGLNPYRLFDERYAGFLGLVSGQISASIASARAYEEEKRRAEALAEVDRAKTAFFSNVSHEFRTPLTLMLGPLEDLLQGEFGRLTDAQQAQGEILHRNARRLLKLVNTLLDFSRIEAGRVQASYAPTDLAAFTADLASAFRSAVERAHVRLVVDCAPLGEPVYVDRSMWEKIVLNLISNAFKFTFEGEITVRLESHQSAVVLTVEDTGIGVAEHELPRLFERFHRVEGARGRTHEGSGIGLALVHELVKLHGGSVQVASTVGQGTRFAISLPKGKAHLPADRVLTGDASTSAPTGLEAFVDEAAGWVSPSEGALPSSDPLTSPGSLGAFQAETYVDATGSTRRARVALADDNADMRDYVRRLLQARYEVDTYPDGLAAMEGIRSRPPDLILTDVMMPGLDGFGLLREVRGDVGLRATPLIMLSARSGEESRIEGMEAGADDYLVKPFSARELLARVGAHLEMSRLRLEAAGRERELLQETQAAKQSLERTLTSLRDSFCTLDRSWRFTYANEIIAANAGVTPAQMMGRTIWDVFPGTEGSLFHRELAKAVKDAKPGQFEYFYPATGHWFEVRVYPYPEGVTLLATDTTPRKLAEERLRELLVREQAAVRYRDEFLGIASHELRTPISSMQLQLQLTQRAAARSGGLAALPPERLGKLVAVFSRQIGNLGSLIEDLLDVSRIANGRLTIEPVPMDLVKLVRETVDQATDQLAAARCETRLELPDALAGWWDPRRLEQVIVNLVSNAIKYAAGQPLHVGLMAKDGRALLRVQDFGMGIPESAQAKIFDRFERAVGHTSIGGLGLGLYITREIILAHGGTIHVESEVGRGSTFFVDLPLDAGRSTPETSLERAV